MLRTVGNARATKEWSWNPHQREWRKISYQAGAWFEPTQHQVENLGELVAILDRVRADPRAFVVRGDLTEAVIQAVQDAPRGQPHRIRRRKHEKGGVAPSLVETARRWVMVDIDNWPLRAVDDLATDPEDAIDNAIHELLPEQFHDSTCWWQLSSSAGFVPGFLKAHLWFWLTEPATNLHLKAVFEQQAPGIDRAPFSAAQPHFVADPIIEGGHDPLPRRCGWRRGLEPAVELPALKPRVQQAKPAGTGSMGRIGGVGDALALLGHGEAGQGFHAPIRAATLQYARECSRGRARDDDGLKEHLRQAIRTAPCRPGGNVEHPYCQDFYLQASIDGAFALLAGDAELQTMRPHHAASSDTLEEARAALDLHIKGYIARALVWGALNEFEQKNQLPEHGALIIGTGAGKSYATRAALAAFISAAKAAKQPHRVLWLVPTHKLGNEALEDMRQLGINAAIWRGRDRDVPGTGTGDAENDVKPQMMCLNIDAVHDAITVLANVEQSVCGAAKGSKPKCPWRVGEDQCVFQRQKPIIARADVVIAAQQTMFLDLPKEIGNLGLVVLDESWWQAGLHTYRELFLDGFADEVMKHPVLVKEKIDGISIKSAWNVAGAESETSSLHEWSVKAEAAFSGHSEGSLVSKASVEEAGLTAKDCAQAVALEWRRLREGIVYPGQAAKDRRKLMDLAMHNAAIPRRVAIWRALGALLDSEDEHTGRLEISSKKTPEGSVRTIVLRTRSDIKDQVSGLPMLLLDATMPLEVVRHFLPRVELLAELRPISPHMKVHQIIGGWGKTSLDPDSNPNTPENERERRRGLVRELSDFVALKSGGDGLVVTYEAIEAAFERPGVRTGHFNAIAGLDGFKDVKSAFIIGRPLPQADDLRAMALALTGRPVVAEGGQVETRGALMEDGTGAAMNVRTYSDPDMEALRVAVTESEVIQAVGRVRGVNRTAANPVDVWLFADVATAIPINRMVRWSEIRPGNLARMASRGLMLSSPADAARIYPDLFPTPEAAKKALQRELKGGDFGDISLLLVLIGECPRNRLVEVRYRPAGRGQQNRRAWVGRDRVEGLAEWLTLQLGVAVSVEVVALGVDPEPPPPPTPGPSPSSAPETDAPPLGHPAGETAPVEDWGGWEPADYSDVMVLAEDVGGTGTPDEPRKVSEFGTLSFHDDAGPTVCDVPWLHADAPAFMADDGAVILPVCPFCGGRHRHRGFGHRLAHCDRQLGRGYVLREVRSAAVGFAHQRDAKPAGGSWSLGP